VLVVALVVAGCGQAPEDELGDAARATADETITFDVSARADDRALDDLGADAADAAAFLDDAGVTGAREPGGRLRIALTIGGQAPLLDVLSDPDGTVLLRTGLGELFGVPETDPGSELDPLLEGIGVDAAGRDALAASFRGAWIELTDVSDLGELVDGATGEPGAAGETGDSGEAEPVTLERVLETVTVIEARDAGDVRRLDVEVSAAALLTLVGATLDDPPPPLPGTVVVRDGLVREVRVDLDGEGGDEVEVVATITPADDTVVQRPTPEASLTGAELFDLVSRLQGTEEVSPP
jgi:hypothetical protein